jgi:antirestriction protein ArdC
MNSTSMTALSRITHALDEAPFAPCADFGRKPWGDEGYAQEEVVAELGAAFLGAHLELATDPCEENASYFANWLGVLKNDTRFIFKAAAHAQRAADYLRAFGEGDVDTAADADADARAT